MNDVLFQLINRIINTTDIKGYYLIDKLNIIELDCKDKELCKEHMSFICPLHKQLIVITVENIEMVHALKKQYANDNLLIFVSRQKLEDFSEIRDNDDLLYVKLAGYLFDVSKQIEVPRTFSVLAIIHFYNEIDVIQRTTEYLLDQGLDVYLVDNWSDDGSYNIAKKLEEEYSGRVFLERYPLDKKNSFYDWYHQLQRTEEISLEMDYDWYVHYDADEMRISPWDNLNLLQTIFLIDSFGYNLIENTVIDFKITDSKLDSNFMMDWWFDFGHRPTHFEQVKTWKKSEFIDLKKSGGHIAVVNNPKIFPLKILNRHYPLRSVIQAQKKIFSDRKPRFVKEKKERGWHGHYDAIHENSNLICKTDDLLFWDDETMSKYYIALFTGCGVEIEKGSNKIFVDDYSIPAGKDVILYGAGKIGCLLYDSIYQKYNIVHWVDLNYARIPKMKGMNIETPDILYSGTNEYIIITIENECIATEVKEMLIKKGIKEEKILWNQVCYKKE